MSGTPSEPAAGGPLDELPIARPQLLVLILIVTLAALDGFDALAMAFVAPAVGAQWGIGKGMLGLLLSASLAGMAVGSLLLAPLGDRIGRRRLVLAALSVMTVGSLLCALSPSVPLLAAARLLTGIGIGAMIVMTTLLSAEFANRRRRPVAVAAIATIGFPIGAVLGGLVAAALLRSVGWHAVFVAGAIGGGVMLALTALLLPESPAFLIARPRHDALERLNHVMQRIGQAPLTKLPSSVARGRVPYSALFAPAIRPVTIRLIVINLLVATAAYYILNWLPLLLTGAGFSAATASVVSSASGLIGLFGGVAMGAVAARIRPARLAVVTMAGMAVMLAVIGFIPPVLALFIAAGGVCSFFASGTTGLFYGILTTSFSPLLRSSGIGLVMGIGRITSAGAPALAGWLFANGLSRGEVSAAFALGPLAAAILMAGFARQSRAAE